MIFALLLPSLLFTPAYALDCQDRQQRVIGHLYHLQETVRGHNTRKGLCPRLGDILRMSSEDIRGREIDGIHVQVVPVQDPNGRSWDTLYQIAWAEERGPACESVVIDGVADGLPVWRCLTNDQMMRGWGHELGPVFDEIYADYVVYDGYLVYDGFMGTLTDYDQNTFTVLDGELIGPFDFASQPRIVNEQLLLMPKSAEGHLMSYGDVVQGPFDRMPRLTGFNEDLGAFLYIGEKSGDDERVYVDNEPHVDCSRVPYYEVKDGVLRYPCQVNSIVYEDGEARTRYQFRLIEGDTVGPLTDSRNPGWDQPGWVQHYTVNGHVLYAAEIDGKAHVIWGSWISEPSDRVVGNRVIGDEVLSTALVGDKVFLRLGDGQVSKPVRVTDRIWAFSILFDIDEENGVVNYTGRRGPWGIFPVRGALEIASE